MERFENRVGRGTQGFPKLGKVVFVFFPLPKFGKCCRYRFYGFPRLGSVAGGVLQVFRFWEGLPTPSGRFPKVGNTCGPCLSYFPILGWIFFLFNLFPKLGSNSLLSTYSLSHSSSHILAVASLGIRQSPRGLRLTLPTFGPSGRHERLNCWAKKRRRKTLSQCFI